MTFQLATIASGSTGNCIVMIAGEERFLIDVGISGKKVLEGLEALDIDPSTLKGIFVTHEHSDHVKGVGIVSRKLNLPIYAPRATWQVMEDANMLGKIEGANKQPFDKGDRLIFGELEVIPYGIYHDSVDPVGYIFLYKGKKIVVATDLGKVDKGILKHFEKADGILLEFNHDVHMLEVGAYPYALKKRILGDYGHLSNDLAGKVLGHIYHEDLKWVMLGHLSKDNNLPELAYLTAKEVLEEKSVTIGEDIIVTVAHRECITPFHSL